MTWVGFGPAPENGVLEAKGRPQSASVFGIKGHAARFLAHPIDAKSPLYELLAVVAGKGCFSITMVVSREDKPVSESEAAFFRSAFSLVSYTPKPPPQPHKAVIEQFKDRSILEVLQDTKRQ